MKKVLLIFSYLILSISINAQKINTGYLGKFNLIQVGVSNHWGLLGTKYMDQKLNIEIERQFNRKTNHFFSYTHGSKSYNESNIGPSTLEAKSKNGYTQYFESDKTKFKVQSNQFEIGFVKYLNKNSSFPFNRFVKIGFGMSQLNIELDRTTFKYNDETLVIEPINTSMNMLVTSIELGNRIILRKNLFVNYGCKSQISWFVLNEDPLKYAQVYVAKTFGSGRYFSEQFFQLKGGIGYTF